MYKAKILKILTIHGMRKFRFYLMIHIFTLVMENFLLNIRMLCNTKGTLSIKYKTGKYFANKR